MRFCPLHSLASAGMLLVGLLPTPALAIDLPPLTGRVVDQAGVMSAQSRSAVEEKLKTLENQSGIQLVVATVKSLQGGDIESYANQLFRTWKLGEAQKNNGVLLLVAPADHKVRIEVGYGLEGTLTDALASVIISSAIVPRFKANDFSGGIERGVDGIISVLRGDSAEWQRKVDVRPDDNSTFVPVLFIVGFAGIAVFFIWRLWLQGRSGRYVKRGGRTVFVPAGGSSWGSGWGGSQGGFSSDGGGFSGGGGSSGGGGASGSW